MELECSPYKKKGDKQETIKGFKGNKLQNPIKPIKTNHKALINKEIASNKKGGKSDFPPSKLRLYLKNYRQFIPINPVIAFNSF